MKKIIALITFITLTISLTVGIHAIELNGAIIYSYEELGIEVTFANNTNFSAEQQQRIADILANDITPVETKAWCWLTGHSYVSDAVTVITHKADLYNPRCLEQTYEITTCKNCNYYDEELLGSIYITCCPEE